MVDVVDGFADNSDVGLGLTILLALTFLFFPTFHHGYS